MPKIRETRGSEWKSRIDDMIGQSIANIEIGVDLDGYHYIELTTAEHITVRFTADGSESWGLFESNMLEAALEIGEMRDIDERLNATVN